MAVHIKNCVLAAMAAVGTFIANALGGWDAAMKLLVAMMAVDYITGWLVAAVWHRSPKSVSGALNSNAGFKGLCKKGAILLVVWIGTMLDSTYGGAYIRTAVILFFIGNEGLSVLENLGLMGVPYPKFLNKMLEALQEQGDKGSSTLPESEANDE